MQTDEQYRVYLRCMSGTAIFRLFDLVLMEASMMIERPMAMWGETVSPGHLRVHVECGAGPACELEWRIRSAIPVTMIVDVVPHWSSES